MYENPGAIIRAICRIIREDIFLERPLEEIKQKRRLVSSVRSLKKAKLSL